MAVSFDGVNKIITVTTDTEFQLVDIYADAKRWEDDAGNMQYHSPLDATVDLRFTLNYNWRFKPSGYSSGTTISVDGTLVTMGTNAKTTPATVGSQVTWNFDAPATAILVSVGSGLSTEEHDKLMALSEAGESPLYTDGSSVSIPL